MRAWYAIRVKLRKREKFMTRLLGNNSNAWGSLFCEESIKNVPDTIDCTFSSLSSSVSEELGSV